MKIAFDVDDTLITPSVAIDWAQDTPSYEVISIYKWFESQGCHMIVWSGGGIEYAKRWADKLGLKAEVREKKKSDDVDIAFDDCEVDLGKVNVRVKRVNNNISRKDWNDHGKTEKR